MNTPIQKMSGQYSNNDIFIKRDDLIPFSFGGNKVRKAKLFFEDIENKKCDCIVTYGSSSSNHCRIVSNMSAARGIKCIIITPNEKKENTYNRKMMDLFGAEIINCKISDVKETIESTLDKLREKKYKPYFIQGGGHGDIGTKAYVNAFEEILSYEIENKIKFDYIFHTSGTGTTQAGLICGSLLNKDRRKIIGISNARKNPNGSQVVLDSVNSYLKSIGNITVGLEVVDFVDEYIINGYGSSNDEVMKTIREILVKDGVPLDMTYTGKGFWGMKKYLEKNQIIRKNILFIHTGGTPLFFDDLEAINND
ncbi:pyridoxal-phosphate dependent enzyme [Jeotgalibaca sp. MA1X17-3]|uniref:1-aminocyclopropane-1-carboxylate deaminase/D-cysteine desulfhydrase n=1 Tax=Jeotgalibaca sp. MA1X17-3 TaxID=2908211 RepID=UPI001F3084AD|nr:pyridoxal-phosphate dependent enzyme [Jeotgalibaca sp. MA1X17-3]UJF15267.1 pyridoxal-phosphate dependent enzyme [Jeotgalibaca sp. MA1X17-3]